MACSADDLTGVLGYAVALVAGVFTYGYVCPVACGVPPEVDAPGGWLRAGTLTAGAQ